MNVDRKGTPIIGCCTLFHDWLVIGEYISMYFAFQLNFKLDEQKLLALLFHFNFCFFCWANFKAKKISTCSTPNEVNYVNTQNTSFDVHQYRKKKIVKLSLGGILCIIHTHSCHCLKGKMFAREKTGISIIVCEAGGWRRWETSLQNWIQRKFLLLRAEKVSTAEEH